nr:hypothetical protein GCM10020093_069730 [Planobispora longispora]
MAENRLLNVSATRLPVNDGAAVVVFHDVTEERRNRDELAAFAGVVAHDLLNPLTTLDGWTQILADAVEAGPGDGAPGEVGISLDHIQRASSRMRELIQDLLAHTTARDAPITPSRSTSGKSCGRSPPPAATSPRAPRAARPRSSTSASWTGSGPTGPCSASCWTT